MDTKNPEAFGHSAVSPVRFQGWEGSRLIGVVVGRVFRLGSG